MAPDIELLKELPFVVPNLTAFKLQGMLRPCPLPTSEMRAILLDSVSWYRGRRIDGSGWPLAGIRGDRKIAVTRRCRGRLVCLDRT